MTLLLVSPSVVVGQGLTQWDSLAVRDGCTVVAWSAMS